ASRSYEGLRRRGPDQRGKASGPKHEAEAGSRKGELRLGSAIAPRTCRVEIRPRPGRRAGRKGKCRKRRGMNPREQHLDAHEPGEQAGIRLVLDRRQVETGAKAGAFG